MEERILYLDMVNGISGDMTLASLLDLEIPEEIFLEELSKLNLDNEYEIKVTSKEVNGIIGKNVEVIIKDNNISHNHRNLIDIYDIIDKSQLSESVKELSKNMFMTIAKAEAKVHGTTIDKVHFHEVGAVDSIVDIVGCSILIDILNIDKVYASTIPLGSGFVKCDHGIIPVPAPATIEILKGAKVKLNNVRGECTTPTGAAIAKTLVTEFVDDIEFEVRKIGYGMGKKEFEVPNILRAIIGVKKKKK
jgi:pyridinium-3,5-bisthiocarboxylic acid mononucleotide nickel chelatase